MSVCSTGVKGARSILSVATTIIVNFTYARHSLLLLLLTVVAVGTGAAEQTALED